MAVIEKIQWNGEPIKAIIKFDSSNPYIVYNDSSYDNSGNFIREIEFNLNEGNSNVNPLGISTSNSISMQLYDTEDNLSPANTKGKYYGKVVNGVEIELFISYDGVSWEPYGVYYATYWGGGYSEGSHNLVNVTADDKLNTIGNYDLPELPAYSNVQAGDLIGNIMQAIGISSNDYTIDPAINKELPWGITPGNKVRDAFNNICQLLFARVIIDRAGIIRFVPALKVYTTGNEIIIDGDSGYTGTFSNKNNNNINYNKISLKYLEAGDISRKTLFNDNTHSLSEGDNVITDINFQHRALSIEQVNVLHDETEKGAYISSLHYKGYQNGIQVDIRVANGPINECQITGEGLTVSTTDKYINIDIDNSTIIGGSTFEFDTKQMMNKAYAQSLAESLRDYISIISRNIIMENTPITPRLYIGDKMTIRNTGTMYDGVYKVIALNIIMGEDYNLDATLIRL